MTPQGWAGADCSWAKEAGVTPQGWAGAGCRPGLGAGEIGWGLAGGWRWAWGWGRASQAAAVQEPPGPLAAAQSPAAAGSLHVTYIQSRSVICSKSGLQGITTLSMATPILAHSNALIMCGVMG